ncbi:MAG: polymer-forming cytoskeletal protein [Deltaproteobacteria bacterium]|nr:polymer-forming cytoskeletal protein [Deltaproteobacteria bacterium]
MADSNTVVGESILIKGNLEGDEDLTVQGHIEGSIQLHKTLIIEPGGVVKAEVSVANAVVSGIMVGNLLASDSVELTETGRMVGDIRAPRVIINEGALFRGQVDMGDLEMPRPSTGVKPSYRPAPRRMEPTRPRLEPVARPAPKPAPPKAAPPPKAPPKPARPEPTKVVKPPKAVGSKKKVVVKKKR